MRADQQWTCKGALIRGVWALPKLLAEAKSDENKRTKAESSGSNTPWAYRPGEFLLMAVAGAFFHLTIVENHKTSYHLEPYSF